MIGGFSIAWKIYDRIPVQVVGQQHASGSVHMEEQEFFEGLAATTGLPLEILVIDNGRGIPADILEDIYDPFVSTKVNGSGLGLSLVSKVLADHGGVIECTSEAGRTEFRILVPDWGVPELT